jgi:hypothetical protein|nr:MAG TPA: hypothetical protein [Caudoviricetes sp.]
MTSNELAFLALAGLLILTGFAGSGVAALTGLLSRSIYCEAEGRILQASLVVVAIGGLTAVGTFAEALIRVTLPLLGGAS